MRATVAVLTLGALGCAAGLTGCGSEASGIAMTSDPTTPTTLAATTTTLPATTTTEWAVVDAEAVVITRPAAPRQPLSSEKAKTEVQAEAEQVIRDVFPDDLEDMAVAVARCESGLIPTEHRNGHDFGLFQINQVHRKRLGDRWALILDARTNAEIALAMRLAAGTWGGPTGPWRWSEHCWGR